MATVLKSPSPLLPDVSMSQSSVMFAALIGGFVVYLMINQKLAVYWSILIGGQSSTTAPASTPPASTSPTTPTTPNSNPGSQPAGP